MEMMVKNSKLKTKETIFKNDHQCICNNNIINSKDQKRVH